jgi:hypothetical protein
VQPARPVFSPAPKTSTPPNSNFKRTVCRTLQKHGLFSIGKFIKGEDPVFNCCVLSGVVSSGLALDYDREDHARIRFQLAIQYMGKPLGRIDILCSGRLAPLAVKYLRQGDRVAVEGFLSMREWQSDAGEWHNHAYLIAMDLELIKDDDHNRG